MSGHRQVVTVNHDASLGTRAAYVTGFLLSLVLTVIAYALVRIHVAHHHQYPSDNFMMAALPLLAVVQLFVQMVFFLHLGRGSKPRWNIMALAFALIVVVILVVGSLWIMSNLNYRMMSSPSQINQYLNNQGDL